MGGGRRGGFSSLEYTTYNVYNRIETDHNTRDVTIAGGGVATLSPL